MEDGAIDGDIDIAVPYCDSAGAAAEQLDVYSVVSQQKLDALEGDDPPIVELVGLLRDAVRYLLELFVELGDADGAEVLFHSLPSLALGVFGGELGACAAEGDWLLGYGVILERLNLGVYLCLALFHLHPLLLFLDGRLSFISLVGDAVLLAHVPVSL